VSSKSAYRFCVRTRGKSQDAEQDDDSKGHPALAPRRQVKRDLRHSDPVLARNAIRAEGGGARHQRPGGNGPQLRSQSWRIPVHRSGTQTAPRRDRDSDDADDQAPRTTIANRPALASSQHRPSAVRRSVEASATSPADTWCRSTGRSTTKRHRGRRADFFGDEQMKTIMRTHLA